MFVTADVPTPPAAITAIDENWAARTAAPSARLTAVDPRIAAGVAAVLAETPAPDAAANRQAGLQPSAYSAGATAAVEKFAQGFSEARKPACLSPATGGLGIFAIPVIAVQAVRGKCTMP
jgi:hypothetical protein